MSAAERTHEVTAFHEAAEWTGVSSDDRPAWLRMRKTMLTASDVAAIMGEDGNRSAIEVYVDKRVDKVPERLELDDPRFWGNVMEQPMLRAVAAHRGWEYREGGALLRSRRYPFIGATLDAEVDRGDGVWCDFEGKTTEVMGEWNEETGELPTRVLIQVQTQLLVSGAELGIVFALLRRYKPVQIPIYPSPDFHAVIVEHCEAFMERVRTLDPPPPDGSESARRALARLYPNDDGTAVRLPPEAVEWSREYHAINAELRRLEDRKAWIRNNLAAHIGSATYGSLDEPVDERAFWRFKLEGKNGRVLRPVKEGPPSPKMLPAATPETLADRLEASVRQRENVIPIKRKRRKVR